MALNAYEGGQMPLYMRLPKRGFNKPNRKEFAVVNLGLIQKFVDAGKLDASAAIDEAALVASGLVRRKLDGIRVLAKGDITGKLTLSVTGASKAAVEAVEKAGGTLTVTAPRRKPRRAGPTPAGSGTSRAATAASSPPSHWSAAAPRPDRRLRSPRPRSRPPPRNAAARIEACSAAAAA